MKVLRDHQADANAEAQIGFLAEAPLDFARQSRQAEVIKLLEQRGAKPGGIRLPELRRPAGRGDGIRGNGSHQGGGRC